MRNRFLPGLLAFFMLLTPMLLHAAEEYMETKLERSSVSPTEPYVEFHLNYGNDRYNDSYCNAPITITIGATSWSVSNFKGELDDVCKDQRWVFNETKDGMNLLAGYHYTTGNNFWAKFRVYFTKLNDGQAIKIEWKTSFIPDRGKAKAQSGVFNCSATIGNFKMTSEPSLSELKTSFETAVITPSSGANATYEYYILKENRPVSEMTGSTGTYSVGKASATGGSQTIKINVIKNISTYLTRDYYPRYTMTYKAADNRTVTFYEKLNKTLKTSYPLKGSGTASDPFQIYTADELEIFRDMVNSGQKPDICAIVKADIDMSGRNWLPIGRCTENSDCKVTYTGTFDGGGYVISNLSGSSTNDHDMALIGRAGKVTVKNVLLKNVNMHGRHRASTVLAFTGSGAVVKNCGAWGTITLKKEQTSDKTAGLGGLVGWTFSTTYIQNSFTTYGNLCANDITATYSYTSNDIAKMLPGELCHRLNSETSVSPVWFQTIGQMDYPAQHNGQTVNKTGIVYHNGKLPFKGYGTKDDPFQLAKESDLRTFKEYVNKGFSSLCAILVADIDYSDNTLLTDMIGTETYPYCGTFNGNAKNLNIGFTTDKQVAGLFRMVNNATIENLMLTGTIQGTRVVGSLIGRVNGTTSVNCVISDVQVRSTHDGDAACSGLVGEVFTNGSLSMTACAFRGSLLGKNTRCCGGFVGWVYNNAKAAINNSYFSPKTLEFGSGSSFTFVRHPSDVAKDAITINYSVYSKQFGTAQGLLMNEKQMQGGEACFYLNGNSNNEVIWLQTLGTDSEPQLWNAKRVYRLGDGQFRNFASRLPGSGTLVDPFLIGSATDLESFRDMVNSGMPSLCGRLTADLNMRDRNWIPIGRNSDSCKVNYTGTLDGDGFVIRDLSGQSPYDNAMGLIGQAAKGCVVKNLILENVHLRGPQRCAAIIGYASETVRIDNCASIGVLKFEGKDGQKYGGILCGGNLSYMKNCYTVYENLTPDQAGSDASNFSAVSAAIAKSGELCYKLNGGKGEVHHWLQELAVDPYPMQRNGRKVFYDKNKKIYVNKDFTEEDNTLYNGSLTSSDLQIIHHGGHLYEFVIVLGKKDGQGDHPYPNMKLSYKQDGTWVDIASLTNINREKVSFTKDWSGELTIEKGIFFSPHTYEVQPPVFWIMQGNHSSKKAASLLWLAPSDVAKLPTMFMIQSTDQERPMQTSNVAVKTTAPTGANSVTVVEPYIDPLLATTPGASTALITTPNPVYSLGVWDATDDCFISTQEISEGTQSLQVSLPQQDCTHQLVALMYARQMDFVNMKMDTTYVTYGIPFTQKPLHAIRYTNVAARYNHSNTLEWGIAFPNDSDMLEGDLFNVYRAYKADYSDAASVQSRPVRGFSSTMTKNDTLMGVFTYKDTSLEGMSTSQRYDETLSAFDQWSLPKEAKTPLTAYKYPARYIYYAVDRSTVSGIWKNAKDFNAQWKVLLTNVLPKVDTIRVIKTADWNKTHKVELHLVLNNPYPQDLVPQAYRDTVIKEAKKQGFIGQMFRWDENASIIINRRSPSGEWNPETGKDEASERILLKGSDVKLNAKTGNYYAVVTDIQSLPETHYYYTAHVDNSTSDYPICNNMKDSVTTTKAEADACFTSVAGAISNFKATQGTEVGRVSLTWDADNSTATTYSLQKNIYAVGYLPVAKSDSVAAATPSMTLSLQNGSATDESAQAGIVYKYTLKQTVNYRGKTRDTTAVAYGWSPYWHGAISGHVKMPNGSAIPGDVSVSIRLKNPKKLEIRNIYAPDKTTLIMPGYKADSTSFTVSADGNGYYQTDSLCYYGTGIQYEVQASCNGATFVSGAGTSPTSVLTLEDANYNYSDVDFLCRDTKRFSGRILYTGSTVPVREMTFFVNGRQLTTVTGEPVMTDAMGNFSFTLPKFKVQIQAQKLGHKLSGDGFILGGPKKDQTEFIPEEDYDNLLLGDSTRIRLVGRIVGGDAEGSKPLGFGQSENNLGDSITLTLQLEGDNTSYIYFNAQNPDETAREEVFHQEVMNADSMKMYVDETSVSFQRKRIVVRADNSTGEFCLDLIPTKYKVSQMSVEGYSTLYQAGEGVQVIDLTDSIENHRHYINSGKTVTEYSAGFNRVYHSPAILTLTQTQPSTTGFVGAKNVTMASLLGYETIQTAWSENGTAHYTFGHPVFEGGTTYTFLAKAVEEYRYNNVSSGALSTSPVGNRTLTVSNGLSSAQQKMTIALNGAGKATFSVTPSNTTFSFTGEDALFVLSASVDVNGYAYEAEPIKAYVTGARDMGVGVQAALQSKPTILDIIRDPYGNNSYAYREEGTTYSWSRHYEKDWQEYFNFSISAGIALLTNIGFGYVLGTEFDLPLLNFNLNKITKHQITASDGEYSLTLKERIATSSDPLDVGAMADVYIGKVSTMDVRKSLVFSVMDKATYSTLTDAATSGALKTVCQGKDRDGNVRYLVVGQGVGLAPGTDRLFVYSQKYIIGSLIPELEKQRNLVFRLSEDASQAQKLANETGRIHYCKEGNDYVPYYPTGFTGQDSVKLYTHQIEEWKQVIADNEKAKYDLLTKTPDRTYSIAQASIDYSEEASTYYRTKTSTGPEYYTLSGGVKGNTGYGGSDHIEPITKNSSVYGLGVLLDLNLGGGNNTSITNSIDCHKTSIGGSGYCLSASGNANIDMDVYCLVDSKLVSVNSTFKSEMNDYNNGKELNGYKQTSGENLQMTDSTASLHNYVFVQRGGATRDPWTDADSTFYYKPNYVREPLGARTLRIDNPKIYVENPIIYNQPQDEAAIFTIRLANESEINDNTKYLAPSTLYLNVDETTNPYGAKLSIDGLPVRTRMEFYLNPGQSAVKTLEVRRGGKPFDYENIKLQFTDNPDIWSMCDEAVISVHYLPTSSPVNLSMPADNWLMNTLSQTDDEGKYYIPVQIDGFSTTQYDNFDHIELQYKKQTDGEDQWVNLCSYYADEKLYKNATGNKAMIETEGKIPNIRFYGEKDPVEMKYDLRAVSFCRLGTGYVTRYSKVVSGTKDTRCPEVFGKPTPANGILGFDDVISLPFTEAIAYNYLDETANFSVQGYTSSSDADHSAYIYFPGTDHQSASSKVSRSVNCHDFTVEMMVKVTGSVSHAKGICTLFTLFDYPIVQGMDVNYSVEKLMNFSYDINNDCLMAQMGDIAIRSVRLSSLKSKPSLTGALTHVAMNYSAEEKSIRFIIGEEEIPLDDASKKIKCTNKGEGRIHVGSTLKGQITDIRLWSRCLSAGELARKYNKSLSNEERDLIAYWPMKEVQGNVLADEVGGADLYLTDVTWQTPVGYSLRLDNKAISLTPRGRQLFTLSKSDDYTLSFWFRNDADTISANTMIFSAGSDGLADKGMDKMRIGFVDGSLLLKTEGNTIPFGTTASSLKASVWHHLAIAVNHSLNTASLFVDGIMVNEASAEMIGGITGSYVAFGDAAFRGNIDNISLWSMALPSSYIHACYNTGLTGRETELLVNLNFEQQLQNAQGTPYIGFSPMNNVIVKSTGKIAGDTLLVASQKQQDGECYAPIRGGSGLQNIPFSWTSTENALQINLKKAEADINHQHLNLVVRNVEDINGNPMKNAQMWSVYVNRNVLEWEQSAQSVELPYGYGTELVASWKNKSGRVISYSVESEATWLKLDNTKGTMGPISTASVNLSVSDGLSPGLYTTNVYLTDEDNLVSKMALTVKVVAKAPDWEPVNSIDYPLTMQVLAVVKQQKGSGEWIIDMNKEDIVGAFVDNICLGTASLSIDEVKNVSYLFMNIAGNDQLRGKEIRFNLWDSSKGEVFALETGTSENGTFKKRTLQFSNGVTEGTDTPIEMRTTSSKIQVLHLEKGWNWVSFNVKAAVNKGLNGLFADESGFQEGDIVKRAGTVFSIYQKNGRWDNSFDKTDNTLSNVWQIYKQEAKTLLVCGSAIGETERYVTLSFGSSQWAELAYLSDETLPIGIALSDFPAASAKAPAGTVIKNLYSFAVARDDGHWLGSLEYLRPGEGYYVRRNGLRDSLRIYYYNTTKASTKAAMETPSVTDAGLEEYLAGKVGGISVTSQHSQMMPVIATFAEGTYKEGDLLVALFNGDVAGVADAVIDDRTGQPLFFLSVHASDESPVRFVKIREGEVVGESRNSLVFKGTDVIGSLEHPYLIDFSESTSEGVFDATGIRFRDEEDLHGRRGVFIVNGRKIVK